ncbi:uncharacterized protein CC84DRAFT_1207257 [Paraphaeosphaeria sporulosa]|uniref:Uncharacterized protein n=1 Tax=Paraphaeosphaeria sporulosa TaxID=1460663 RepID=A0A177CB19_9PLEO|nr:uncharacterized protein CC84DRAFT_1207257 [Paraphaeosphaeria sporulosa]OAG04052.1 hypothetical protein CC84DRAFT_1207257 [Paraphaeosphaeria sporulosa]
MPEEFEDSRECVREGVLEPEREGECEPRSRSSAEMDQREQGCGGERMTGDQPVCWREEGMGLLMLMSLVEVTTDLISNALQSYDPVEKHVPDAPAAACKKSSEIYERPGRLNQISCLQHTAVATVSIPSECGTALRTAAMLNSPHHSTRTFSVAVMSKTPLRTLRIHASPSPSRVES